VIFESPHRIAATLQELSSVLGPRRGCVARELTKLYEEVVRGELPELVEAFAEQARGEISIVVEGYDADQDASLCDASASEELDREIRSLVEAGQRPREIAAALAPRTGFPKREIYARAVATREGS
jgi:16S rRNA (cytidine1402-2'-O)-methyltransferase